MIFRALALWLMLALPGLAQPLPDPISDTISDFAGLLTPDQAARIDTALRAGREETGVHVVVVVMNRIADHGGVDQRIEDYAKALFNQWGVGARARNDGIMILIARQDREMRIALGAGYESVWDNAAQRVIDRDMLPAFREDRYGDGIESGVAATFAIIVAPHQAGQPAPPADGSGMFEDMIGVSVVIGSFALIGYLIWRDFLSVALVRLRRCPSCGNRSLRAQRTVLTPATNTADGLTQIVTTCRTCDHATTRTRRIARRDASSSGGFGGGSSSGGGASGRW